MDKLQKEINELKGEKKMDKINFEDLPSQNSPINAKNLNQVQANVEAELKTIEQALEEKSNKGTVLYEDEIGITGKNGLTLSQDISDYKKLKIIFDVCEASGDKYVFGIVQEIDVTGDLTNFVLSVATKTIQYATFSISNTSLNITRNRQSNITSTVEGNYIYITKIIGYTEI